MKRSPDAPEQAAASPSAKRERPSEAAAGSTRPQQQTWQTPPLLQQQQQQQTLLQPSPVFVSDAVNASVVSDAVDSMVPADTSRVLLIYTGGTIGMKNNHTHGYIPVRGFLSQTLASMLRFNDRDAAADSALPVQASSGGASGVSGASGTNGQPNGANGQPSSTELPSATSSLFAAPPPVLTQASAAALFQQTNAVHVPISAATLAANDRAELLRQPDVCVVSGLIVRKMRLPALISPPSLYGKRINYSILEYDELLDSSNMTMSDWVKIATDIEVNYRLFDAFVILHGTDTMAYTASALSFLLEDLGKTVILTGSQVPISEVRNDAIENLLGALTIAGHFVIPEVGLFFDNKLFRGNRASKVNALEFNAFDSPNLRPLVNVGINIDVSWVDVWRPKKIAQFRTHKVLNPSVATLRLFPGITEATVRAFLSPPIAGVVLETYGSGNAPSNRPDLLTALKEASDRGVVIVNCTQCKRGNVADIYETGKALLKIGLVPGADMTPECALTKLSYLLGKHSDVNICRNLMRKNLRGELTVPTRRQRFTYLPHPSSHQGVFAGHSTLVASVLSMLGVNLISYTPVDTTTFPPHLRDRHGSVGSPALLASAAASLESGGEESGHDDENAAGLERALIPMLLCQAARAGDVAGLRSVIHEYEYMVNVPDYDGRSPLHVAACEGQQASVEMLLLNGANVHLRDRFGHSPLFDAVRSGHADVVRLLRKAGAHFSTEEGEEVTAAVCRSVTSGDAMRFRMFVECGVDLNKSTQDARTPLHLAVAGNQTEIVDTIIDTALSIRRLQMAGQTPPASNAALTAALDARLSPEPMSPNEPIAVSVLQRPAFVGSVDSDADAGSSLGVGVPLKRSLSQSALPHSSEVDFDAVDFMGRTPLDEARRLGHTDLVAKLEAAHAALSALDST